MDLSELTTMKVGGPAREYVRATTSAELVDAILAAWGAGDEWLILGGGSNMVVADEGFDGTVIHVATTGIERLASDEPRVRLKVQAGESWDGLVAHTVAQGWSGIEALSGIPGSVGASPIQNIGAYGQELSSVLVSIDFLDYDSGEVETLATADLGLDYRTSAMKRGRAGVVLAVELELEATQTGEVAYPQLAQALGVELGSRVPIAQIRDGVLALRKAKGMVVDAADPDSVSCGSFFTNPILGENFARGLPADAPRWPMRPAPVDLVVPLGSEPAAPPPREENLVKVSAAWLIERAGVTRGFSLPGSHVAISSKHSLAISNRGGGTAEEVAELARF
ncbi:MAG: UDP-N-acetylmuramate dehydrogenase, partial [Rhodoglobus sp.]|nr:UDP-N-acetylmuramate dehydrogenase [Rhodoglobus sp.]